MVSTGDVAYNLPWYQMHPYDRICVKMIIRRSQRPRELNGLGVFVCSLEVYLRVEAVEVNCSDEYHFLFQFLYFFRLITHF